MVFRADVLDPRDADCKRLSSIATHSIAKHELISVTGKICLDNAGGRVAIGQGAKLGACFSCGPLNRAAADGRSVAQAGLEREMCQP